MQTEQRYSVLATEDLEAEYGSTKKGADNVKVAKEIVQHEQEVLQKALSGTAGAAP